MSDGDACSVHCGYCGRCSSGPETAERTCGECGQTFDQSVSEPYLVRVICDDCAAGWRARQQRREDFFGAGQKVKAS